MAFSIQREPAFQQDPLFKIAVKNHERVYTKPGEIKYFDKNLYYTVPIQAGGGGGALQLHLYGGVWPQGWKIDPSAGFKPGKLTHSGPHIPNMTQYGSAPREYRYQIPSSRIFIRTLGQQEIRQPNIKLEHTSTYTNKNHAL